jgi:two-component system sensor histidine kinase RstB
VSLPEVEPPYLHVGFLERLAHELRGPVGVTSGALDEIELGVGPEAEKLQTYFLMARRGMGRVLRLAERLQRTSQLESGKIEWARAPVDLRGLVERAAKESELLEARRAVRVSVCASDEACPVAVDSPWMLFALGELVGNAIRFARSAVTVRCERVGREVTFIVSDDGPGFDGPAMLRFEPPTDKRGVGLSLPLVRDVVAAHDGRLEIDGTRDSGERASSGAIVTVRLPRFSKVEP